MKPEKKDKKQWDTPKLTKLTSINTNEQECHKKGFGCDGEFQTSYY